MISVTPVVSGNEVHEVTYAKDDPHFNPLTVLRTEHVVMSRWTLTDEERAYIANGGDFFICQIHGGGMLQPIMPMACPPDEALHWMITLGAPL